MIKTLDEAQIGALIRKGCINVKDLAEDPPEPQDTTLKDGLAAIVTAIKDIDFPSPEKVNVAAPQVTVNVPKRDLINLVVKVIKRDKNGFIDEVSFREVAP